jgi:hypothetical protein
LQQGPVQADALEQVFIDHQHAARHGAHGVFGMLRHAELAGDQHVQRRAQRLRHFEGHRHAAPGQRQHLDVVAAGVGGQVRGQRSAGMQAVAKDRGAHGAWAVLVVLCSKPCSFGLERSGEPAPPIHIRRPGRAGIDGAPRGGIPRSLDSPQPSGNDRPACKIYRKSFNRPWASSAGKAASWPVHALAKLRFESPPD